MDSYYLDILQEAPINNLAERYRFAHKSYVEKFVMCFEAHHRIARVMRCIVRGGLCMPFHRPDHEVRRMSIDVDIMSPLTVAEVSQAIDSIGGDGLTCHKRTPISPYPIDNLVSYDVTFPSCLENNSGNIKIDAFCEADLDIASKRIPKGSDILGFDMRQDMTILSRGSLLADKCTTMARGTIGLKSGRETEVAKQIYDMAVLLRSASRDDLETAYDAYVEMTRFKAASFRRDPPYTIPDIASNAAESIRDLLTFDTTVTVTGKQDRRYNNFSGSYLSKKHMYRKTEHVTDVLLAYLFALSIRRYLAPIASGHDKGDDGSRKTREVDFMHEELEKMSHLEQLGQGGGRRHVNDDRQVRAEIIRNIPDSFVNKKILRGARLEHVSLVRALSTISRFSDKYGQIGII